MRANLSLGDDAVIILIKYTGILDFEKRNFGE